MDRIIRRISVLLPLFFGLGLLLSACKSPPVPPAPPEHPPEELLVPNPAASLVFESVEADTPVHLSLNFTLNIENPVPSPGRAKLTSWQAEINGQKAGSGFSLEGPVEGSSFIDDFFPLRAAAPASFPLKLNMDVDSLAAQGLAPADDYKVNLIMELDFSFDPAATHDTASPVRIEISGPAEFPGVQAPVFSITAIAILKAELVNTRFRVGLKIENPNPFPVDLSAFGYVLYGNNAFWADGEEKNIIKVSGRSSLTGNLFLVMNFIDMNRALLNQIVRLEDVNYRFTGETEIITGIKYLPKFKSGFDLSGYSKVLEN